MHDLSLNSCCLLSICDFWNSRFNVTATFRGMFFRLFGGKETKNLGMQRVMQTAHSKPDLCGVLSLLSTVLSININKFPGRLALPRPNSHLYNVSNELKDLATDAQFLFLLGSWFLPDSSEVQPLRLSSPPITTHIPQFGIRDRLRQQTSFPF